MENYKQNFLSSLEQEENKNTYIRKKSTSSSLSIGTLKKNEIHGIILSCLAYFCVAFGVFYTKLVQKTYPNDFHSIQFLFLRSFDYCCNNHNYFPEFYIDYKKWK